MQLRAATDAEAKAWRADWAQRLADMYAARGFAATEVAEAVANRVRRRAEAADSVLDALVVDDRIVGYVAASMVPPAGMLDDVWVAPAERRRGDGSAALARAERWTAEHGGSDVQASIDGSDPAQSALLRRYGVRAQIMSLDLDGSPELPPGLAARPMRVDEYPTWVETEISGYADDLAESGRVPPAAAFDEARKQFAELLPDGLETPGHSLSVLEADGEPVAWLWIEHGRWSGRSFVYSVSVAPSARGRGYGRAVMRYAERLALEHGDHILALNVFGPNTVAINLYASLGYLVQDQFRSKRL